MLTDALKQALKDAGLGAPRGVEENAADGYAEGTVDGDRFRATADGSLYLVLTVPELRVAPGVSRPGYDATYPVAGPAVAGPVGRRAAGYRAPTLKQHLARARRDHAEA